MDAPMSELEETKRKLQRKRQVASDKGKNTTMFDRMISVVQTMINNGQKND